MLSPNLFANEDAIKIVMFSGGTSHSPWTRALEDGLKAKLVLEKKHIVLQQEIQNSSPTSTKISVTNNSIYYYNLNSVIINQTTMNESVNELLRLTNPK